jgi:hypothetical protein
MRVSSTTIIHLSDLFDDERDLAVTIPSETPGGSLHIGTDDNNDLPKLSIVGTEAQLFAFARRIIELAGVDALRAARDLLRSRCDSCDQPHMECRCRASYNLTAIGDAGFTAGDAS